MQKTKTQAVLLAFLILLSVIFAGCGAKEQAPATEPAITVTSYALTHVESGIISYTADEFEADGTLDLYSDGTASIRYGDQEIALLYDESNMWSADQETELHPYQISGLVLTLDYFSETLTFVQK